VVNPLVDVDALAHDCCSKSARVICKGHLADLNLQEYFVIFENRALKEDTLLSAVDLAFKTYYVFNIPFPQTCAGT
ncbi:unnamed protein product, partial [Allacma fusca]